MPRTIVPGKEKTVIVEYEGSIARAELFDGLLKCPYCNDRPVLFYSARDYMRHLLAHALNTLEQRKEPPSRYK